MATDNEQAPKLKTKPELPHCGVIMPISGNADYPASHWADMLQLIKEAAQDAKYTCEIVSATGRDDIIHASIVTNIYLNEMVICDVSSRNPNVMLELGLRLASKLPIIIIFDGEGNYPFDIGTIRYLGYRRDMRYYDMNKFKKELTTKILEVADTHKKGKYQSFLSHFKNIDFDLDTVGTEKQNLTQILERLDKRLGNLENQRNNSTPAVPNTAITYKGKNSLGALLTTHITNYASENGITSGDKFSHNHVTELIRLIRSDLNSPLADMRADVLAKEIVEWDGLPF